MRGFPLQPVECLARDSHGIQPNSEEKEIVCQVWSPDTVEGWSPDTISLLLPNGMVEIVGSIPSNISKHKQTINNDKVNMNLSVLSAWEKVWYLGGMGGGVGTVLYLWYVNVPDYYERMLQFLF